MRLHIAFIIGFFICCSTSVVSAQDSLAINKTSDSALTLQSNDGLVITADSVLKPDSVKKKRFEPNAKRAGLYSALIPGFGQLYNRQYWKMPIVYAVLGTTTYFALKNNSDYRRYRKAYISRLSNGDKSQDEFAGILSTASIKVYQDDAKQNMDMMVVFTVIGYAGQILEAISGAHLRNFDISTDLTMQVRPVLTPLNTPGVGLVFQFKK